MQNVLPLFQIGWSISRIIGLVSGKNGRYDERYLLAWECIKQALSDKAEWELFSTPVPSTDFEAAYSACLEIIQTYGPDQVLVNFTGGTKPMAFGAYRAALDTGASLLYVDTELERFFLQERNAEPRYLPYSLNPISIRRMVNLHGKQIDESRILNKGYADLLQLGREMLVNRPKTLANFQSFQHKLVGDETVAELRMAGEELEDVTWVVDLLHRYQMLSRSGGSIIIPHKTIHFLKGEWLELYTFAAIHQSGQFMDVLAPLAITQFRDEIDTAVIYQGKMGLVECKTGNLRGKVGTAVLKQLNEYRTRLTGHFGKAFLVTTSMGSLAHLKARAKDYSSPIILIANSDLLHLEEIILKGMKAT